jgi:hypothetical protein
MKRRKALVDKHTETFLRRMSEKHSALPNAILHQEHRAAAHTSRAICCHRKTSATLQKGIS